MQDVIGIVRSLAEEVGPRPSTSPAEARAAATVNARMREIGLAVELQPFRAVATSGWPYGLLYLMGALTPLLHRVCPAAALALSVLLLVGFVLETLSFPVVSFWLPSGKSQNVIGTRPSSQEQRRHLVFVAHLDSARVAFPFHRWGMTGRRWSFLIVAAALTSLPPFTALRWALGGTWSMSLQVVPAVTLALSALAIAYRETRMPYVAGANDNASGIAVLLRLAQELNDPQHTALWFVATGSKESGLHGMRHFLRHYPFPKDAAFFLNLDSIGCGELAVVSAEGVLWPHRADPVLIELARRADPDVRARPFRAMRTDAQAAQVRGYRAMSLMAFGEDTLAPPGLEAGDTLTQLNAETMERAVRLAVGIARQLDALEAEPRS